MPSNWTSLIVQCGMMGLLMLLSMGQGDLYNLSMHACLASLERMYKESVVFVLHSRWLESSQYLKTVVIIVFCLLVFFKLVF